MQGDLDFQRSPRIASPRNLIRARACMTLAPLSPSPNSRLLAVLRVWTGAQDSKHVQDTHRNINLQTDGFILLLCRINYFTKKFLQLNDTFCEN